jgi:hypothetical protein
LKRLHGTNRDDTIAQARGQLPGPEFFECSCAHTNRRSTDRARAATRLSRSEY